jgi:hypothetical protein
MSQRAKEILHYVWLIALWAFLMWYGMTAIDLVERRDPSASYTLGIYVFVACSAVVAILHWHWKSRG